MKPSTPSAPPSSQASVSSPSGRVARDADLAVVRRRNPQATESSSAASGPSRSSISISIGGGGAAHDRGVHRTLQHTVAHRATRALDLRRRAGVRAGGMTMRPREHAIPQSGSTIVGRTTPRHARTLSRKPGVIHDDDSHEIHRCRAVDAYSHILSSRRRRRSCCFLMY